MHLLKMSACAAMLVLVSPVMAAHSARNRHAHPGATVAKCREMHARMHGGGEASTNQAPSHAAHPDMMDAASHKGMNCMSHRSSDAVPTPVDGSSTPAHNHDHAGAQPPK